MNDNTQNVLFISDNARDVRRIRTLLAEPSDCVWQLHWERRLCDGINRLEQEVYAVVLLDLFLPDSQGLETYESLLKVTPHLPILVLSDRKNESLAVQATQLGAQDYLLKDHLDAYWLLRILRDAIARKTTEETMFIEKERAMVTLNSIGDAVLSTDIANKVTYLNLVAEEMTGWACEDAIGRPLVEVFNIINGTTRQPTSDPMAQAIKKNQAVGLSANSRLIRSDGFEYAIEDSAAPIHDRRGRVTGAVIVFRDVCMARSVVQKMAHMAQHDFLTQLPNRLLLNDRIAIAIALAARHDKKLAVLYLDLDGFKQINDSQGHATGDKLLKSVALRLKASVRSSDTVSRGGGDEFIILLSEVENAVAVTRITEKILSALAVPYTIAGNKLQISASIGISIYPVDSRDTESLIRNADVAMYHAKNEGRNNYQFFTEKNIVQLIKPQFPKKQSVH